MEALLFFPFLVEILFLAKAVLSFSYGKSLFSMKVLLFFRPQCRFHFYRDAHLLRVPSTKALGSSRTQGRKERRTYTEKFGVSVEKQKERSASVENSFCWEWKRGVYSQKLSLPERVRRAAPLLTTEFQLIMAPCWAEEARAFHWEEDVKSTCQGGKWEVLHQDQSLRQRRKREEMSVEKESLHELHESESNVTCHIILQWIVYKI